MSSPIITKRRVRFGRPKKNFRIQRVIYDDNLKLRNMELEANAVRSEAEMVEFRKRRFSWTFPIKIGFFP